MEEALTVEGNIGNVYNRFYSYSFLNQIYLRMQGVREPVATYKRWQALGRHVVKGTRAKEVWRPIFVKRETEDGDIEERLTGFIRSRSVFALSDTAGAELPPVVLPHWDLNHALGKLAIRLVPFEELNGNVQGYSAGRDIAINPVAVHPTKTLFHEMGHVVLGHTVADSASEYATHRGIMEFQAEATAYLTMNELEQLDAATASHSRGYIQHWLKTETPGEREIRLVFAATDAILKAGQLALSGASEPRSSSQP